MRGRDASRALEPAPAGRRAVRLAFAFAIAGVLTIMAGVTYANSKGKVNSASASLPTAGSAATGVKCPGSTHATGGGVAIATGFDPAADTGTETYPQTNYPPGKSKWRAGASPLDNQPAAALTTYVRCEKKSFGKIFKRVTRAATMASGIGRTVSVVCPAGTQVLGGGYSVSPAFDAGAQSNTTSRMQILQSRRSSSSTWSVSAINPHQPTTQLTVSALCEKNGRQIKTKSAFAPLADKSRRTVTAKCADNQHVDAGGFLLTPLFSNVGIPVVDTSAPSGNRSWKVEAYGPANIPTGSGITAYAYCKSNKRPD